MHKILVRTKLSDEVRTRLEEMIRDEVFPEGTLLPSERDLMAMFDVGRPSIREALYALEHMGLIQITTGERPKVTRPTPRLMLESLSGAARLLLDQPGGVDHFEQLRLFLEISIARHAAEFATEAQLGQLRAALAANEAAIGRARPFAASDVAFHRALTEIPRNPIFLAAHDALVDWLIGQRINVANTVVANKQSYDGHLAIFEAISEKDPGRAEEAIKKHLEDARRKHEAAHRGLSGPE